MLRRLLKSRYLQPVADLIRKRRSVARTRDHSRILARANDGRCELFLQYRPDFDWRRDEVDDYEELYRSWVGCDALPNKGDLSRFFFLYLAVRQVVENEILGDFAEVGVFKGASAKMIATMAPDRMLHLFDTFEGFDDRDLASERDATGGQYPNEKFADASLDEVRAYVGNDDNVTFYPGWFPDSARSIPEHTRFAFAHYDADLYAPAKAFCEFFYPRMSPGGVMAIHDYNSGYQGVKQAVDTFFRNKPEGLAPMPDKSGSVLVVKNRTSG